MTLYVGYTFSLQIFVKEKKQLKVGLLEAATHVEECLKENTQVACIPPPCSPLQLFSTLQPFSSSQG